MTASGLAGRRIDGYDVSFVLAPRVNAAGRMSTPDIATRLLLASDDALAEEAKGLAEQLNEENVRRQQEEAAIVAEAKKIVETDPDVGARTVLVVAGEGWHRGVIGIVASKLVDTFHRPAIVLSIDGDAAQGSCRSIPSFDILAALESCGDVMTRFGGHKVAAGLALDRGRIRELRTRLNAYADERLGPDDLRPRLRIDARLGFRELTGAVAAQVVGLAPFGAGNPKPVFAATNVEIVDGPRRLKDRHFKMALRHDGRVLRAIAWRGAERHAFLEEHRALVDVAYSLEQNEFNGETYLELTVADVRPAEAAVRCAAAGGDRGARRMKWQRVLRFVLVFLAVATAIGVAMSVRKRPVPTNKMDVKRVDPKAIAESARGRLAQMTGMKIPGYLDFDRNLTYEDGSVKFFGAKLTTRRAGREFHLSGNEARVAKEQSHMEVSGNVYLTASDGLKVRTDRATYGSSEHIVRAPNLVKFVKGTMRGSGVGMTYDEQRDVLWLLKDVKITVSPDRKTDDPGATIVSGTAGLARRDKYMRFEGGVSIVRAGRTIEAKSALAYLTDDGNAVKAMELRGDSRIAMKEPAPVACSRWPRPR